MSGLVSSTRCRTSAVSSFRWIAVLTIVAMLGFAGFVLADSGSNQGTKVVPVGQDAKEKKASAIAVLGDAPAGATTNSNNHSGITPLAPPSNDDCTGAIVIPSVPYTSDPVDITDATPQETNDGLHTCAAAGADRTIWWSFTPAVTGAYIITTCPARGATGSTVYDTLISVWDSTGGSCPQSTQLSCDDSTSCSSPLPGAPYVDQATTAPVLTAGTTYFIVAGHWTDDVGGVSPGFEDITVHVELSPAPSNDTCSNPTPLQLNRVTQGTTASATNDYRSPGDATCYSGIGQTPTTAAGLDVVFSFLPPAAGSYNFRYVQDDSAAALRTQNPALYLSHDCPAPAPNGPVVSCIKGANRITVNGAANGNRSEEIDCVPLAAGEQVYLYFDDRIAGNAGGPFAVEVTSCARETEPNDTIATANPYPGCTTRGAANSTTDVDFFDLGAPPAGAKVFTAVDAVAANDSDFEMRLTNATSTLGYDDNDGTSWISANAPVIAGAVADGSNLYARVNKGSLAAQLVAAEPYRLYSRIETGVAQNEVDTPSNASYYFGNHVTGGGFVRGIMATQTDQDCFRFVAHQGDELTVYADNNPARTPGTITNVWPILRDLILGPPTASRFVGQVLRNNLTPSPGTLTGVTPSVTSNFFPYRARYTGTYMVCYTPTQDVNSTENPPAGAYPLPYQGSISLNCGPIPAPASRTTDVSVAKSGPVGSVNTGAIIEYTITLTNSGLDIAEDVRLTDTLPPELLYLSLSVTDGFNGNNIGCLSLPTSGTNDAPIDCTNFSLAPGASTVYTLQVQVKNCIGAGVAIDNTATITTLSTDPNPANDSSTWSLVTTEDGSCNDLLCDDNGCFANNCTVNDHCAAGVCTSEAVDCDDNSLCTEDSCNPTDDDGSPCVNDPSDINNHCGDGNDCTYDICDPDVFCVFPPRPAGIPCHDFLDCTQNDQCDGNGTCVGESVCDDGLPCTDDYADENNACACDDHPVSFPGSSCDDGDACTLNTYCDGTGGTAASCVGGEPNVPWEEVGWVRVDEFDGASQINWRAVSNATFYDVVRGALSSLPVGPGGADESCLSPILGAGTSDATDPAPGQGFFYLIRGRSDCGSGPYGAQGLHGAPSTPRLTTTCGS